MRTYDVDELKTILKMLVDGVTIASPIKRWRAFEISCHLIRREIERMENGDAIDKDHCSSLMDIAEKTDDVDLLKHKVKDMQKRVCRMEASFDSINDRLDRVCASFFPLYEALTRCFTPTEKKEEDYDLILLGMGLVYLPFGILMWLWEKK